MGLSVKGARRLLSGSASLKNRLTDPLTQGDILEEATANAQEAHLYVEGLREDGRSLDAGVIRRRFPVPA